MNLENAMNAGNKGPFVFKWAARQGIFKVILYAKTAEKSIAGWKVKLKDTSGTKSDGQSNAVNTEVPCKSGDPESTGTDSSEFVCDERLAAKEVSIEYTASSGTAELAEVVVVGKTWATYPCGIGYHSTNGMHNDAQGSGCKLCADGTIDERGATFEANSQEKAKACKACDNSAKEIYFTKDEAHKKAAECQSCAAPTVIKTDNKGTCVNCPAGEEYHAVGTGDCNYKTSTALTTAREASADGVAITVTDPKTCTKVICQACPDGHYSEADSGKYCRKCAKNSKTTDKRTCTECDAGKVQNTVGNNCENCEAGKKRAAGEADCTVCDNGHISAAGAATCTQCDEGTYEKDKTSCEQCPKGKFLNLKGQSGIGSCKDCEDGTVSATPGAATCTDCLAGTFAESKDAACKNCGVATVQPNPKKTECVPCAARTIPDADRKTCGECGAGQEYFAKGTTDATNCNYLTGDDLTNARKAESTSTNIVVTDHTKCDEVKCVPCGEGHVRPANSQRYCHRCPVKQHTTDKINCVDCAAGKISNEKGSGCKDCLAGEKRAANEADCSPCDTGHKSDAGASACEKCLKGTYEKDKKDCVKCPMGRYISQDGQTGSDDSACTQCDAGAVALTEGQSECTDCQKGEYETDTRKKCEKCPEGKYNDQVKQSGADKCKDCPGGAIAATKGLETCTKCPGGKEADTARTACQACTAGKFRGADEEQGCQECPAGEYSGAEAAACTKCELGKYQGETGKSSCIQCAIGKYSAELGATECKACASGHVARELGTSKCEPCKPGEKSNAGLTDCVKCEAGNFQDQTGQGTCKQCPSNEYSNEEGMRECKKCVENEYSIPGKTKCSKCPATDVMADIVTALKKNEGDDKGIDENHIAAKKCRSDALGNVCAAASYTNQYGTFKHEEMKRGEASKKGVNTKCDFDTDEDLYATFTCLMDGAGKMYVKESYDCKSTEKTSKINDLAKEDKTEKEKAEKLEDLTEDTATNGIGDVEAVSEVLDSIGISSNVDKAPTKQINETMTKSILNAVSNLVQSDLKVSTDKTESASKISGSVVNQMVNVAKQTVVKNQVVTSPKVAVIDIAKGKDVDPDQPKKAGIVAFTLPKKDQENADLKDCKVESSPDKNENTILLIETKKGAENEEVDMAVVLITDATLMPDPKISVIKKEESVKDEQTVENILKDLRKDLNDTTKTASGEVKQTFVNSFITEVKVENQPPDFKLNLFMKPTIDIGNSNQSLDTDESGRRVKLTYECASYIPEKAEWKRDCKTVYDTAQPGAGVLCLCDHNTSFAVLMSAQEIDRGYAEVQTYLTYILLGASTIGLSLTLVFLLPAKALRSTRSAKINICFTVALLLSSLMFLIQDAFINANDTGIIKLKSMGCAVYAMIQHYLWLVVFCWMVVEGFLMYLSLVQVFGSHISKYMLKFNIAAWGIPLPIPFIGYFVFTKSHTVGSFTFTDHGYLSDTMCFIKAESIPFYALFLAPICLVIVINLVFFALVAKVIKNSKSSGNISDQEQILRQLKAAVGVMVLLGTGWFFGIFMSIPAPQFQVGMQYLFILLNSTQGVFVFLFYIVLNDQVKTHWLVKMGLQEEKRSTTSSSAAGKSTMGTKATAVSVSASPNADNIYENAAASNEEHTYASAEYATASDKAGKHEFPVKSDNNANI